MSDASGKFIGALITVVVSLALLPVVRDFVAAAVNGSSTSEALLLGLVTLFWILATVIIVVGIARGGMKH
jgi:uncharacterized membrane protein